MEINKSRNFVEITDGTFDITFWNDGDIIISGIGYDYVTFSGLPIELMNKIQQAIIDYKEEYNNE